MCEMSKHSMRLRQLRQHESVLQRLLDGFRGRLHHPEALIVSLLGVLPDQIDQRALLSALRNVDLHPPLLALREQFFQRGAIFEIHRHINRVRHILLVEVDLLQQRGEELARLESLARQRFR